MCLRLSLGVQKHTFKSIDGCIAPGSEFVQQTPTTSLRSNTLNCSMEWWHWTAGKTREHSYRLIFDTFVIGSRCPFKQHILQFEPLSPNYPKLCFLDQLINHCVYWHQCVFDELELARLPIRLLWGDRWTNASLGLRSVIDSVSSAQLGNGSVREMWIKLLTITSETSCLPAQTCFI